MRIVTCLFKTTSITNNPTFHALLQWQDSHRSSPTRHRYLLVSEEDCERFAKMDPEKKEKKCAQLVTAEINMHQVHASGLDNLYYGEIQEKNKHRQA